MRIFLVILILIFTLQTLAKANDITDFEIDGIGIGESLLNHLSENEIIDGMKSSNSLFYKNNKFVAIHFPGSENSKIYDRIGVTFKPNDKKYIIHEVKGYLNFRNDLEGCLDKKNEIDSELSNIFNEAERTSGKIKHAYDKSGNSTQESVWYTFDTGFIEVTCHDWSKKITDEQGWEDTLQVNIDSKEFEVFLNNEAYQ